MFHLEQINTFQTKIDDYKTSIEYIIETLNGYHKQLDLNIQNEFINSQLIIEVIDKLKRIQTVLDNIATTQLNMLRQMPLLLTNAFPEDQKIHSKQMEKWIQEAYIFLDSFYYTSFRIFVIFRDKLIPHSPFRSDGIRDVRNRLIEHPEVLSQSMGGIEDLDNGLRLKIARTVGFTVHKVEEPDVIQDKGFFNNLDEFLKNLKTKVDNLVK